MAIALNFSVLVVLLVLLASALAGIMWILASKWHFSAFAQVFCTLLVYGLVLFLVKIG